MWALGGIVLGAPIIAAALRIIGLLGGSATLQGGVGTSLHNAACISPTRTCRSGAPEHRPACARHFAGRSYEVTPEGSQFLVLERLDAKVRLTEIRFVTN
jgi:hypothetical protein